MIEDWLQRSKPCNQIRSHGVRFGKRAVVGAVRVFESYLGLRFLHHEETQETQRGTGGRVGYPFLCLLCFFVA